MKKLLLLLLLFFQAILVFAQSDTLSGSDNLTTVVSPAGSDNISALIACQGIHINTVEVSGSSLLSFRRKAALVAPYQGQCINADGIERLLGSITQHYLDRGFSTTRVYLPDQDLNTGTLKLLVVEGRLASIEVENDPEGRVNAELATEVRPGELLNTRDLEQAVEQINSATGNAVKLDIVPGEIAGESQVVYRNTPGSWWEGSVSANNHADKDSWQGSISLSAGSLLGLNDTATLTGNVANQETQSRSESLSWSFPAAYTTYGVSLSDSYSKTPVVLSSGNTIYSISRSNNFSLSADRVLSRYQTATHTLTSSYSYSDAKNYLAGELLQVSSKITRSLTLGFSSEFNEFYGASLTVSPSLGLGVAEPNNLPGVNEDSAGAPSQSTIYSLNLNYSLPFTLQDFELTWSSIYQTQYTEEAVGGMSIGGLSSVRGFSNTSVSGDLGYYWQNDVSWDTSFEVAGVKVEETLLVAFDMGHVYGVLPGSSEGTLRGLALGATSTIGDFVCDLIWTTPQYISEGLPADDPRLWATVTYSF